MNACEMRTYRQPFYKTYTILFVGTCITAFMDMVFLTYYHPGDIHCCVQRFLCYTIQRRYRNYQRNHPIDKKDSGCKLHGLSSGKLPFTKPNPRR